MYKVQDFNENILFLFLINCIVSMCQSLLLCRNMSVFFQPSINLDNLVKKNYDDVLFY